MYKKREVTCMRIGGVLRFGKDDIIEWIARA
jgi:hypothetical protein